MSITFFIGHGRTGTRSVTHLLAQLPHVTALHEPKPPHLNDARERQRGAGGPWIANMLLRSRDSTIRNSQHYVEATHWFCWLIEDIAHAWPEAKFVWLQRDRDSWAWSAWRKGWYHRLSDGRRDWVPYIRPEPSRGWERGTSRWYKLGYLYARVSNFIERAALDLPPERFCTFAMEDLNDMVRMRELTAWAGLPEPPAEGLTPARVNTGAGVLTMGEMQRAGIDLQLFGVVRPDQEILEDIVAVETLNNLGLRLPADWRPPKPHITPEISKELNAGRALACEESRFVRRSRSDA